MKKILVVFHPLIEGMEYINRGGTQFAPHHFWCYDQLKRTGHQVDFLQTTTTPTFWNKLGDKLGINLLQQQLDCLKAAKDYDLIFVPFMEFSFFIGLMKVLRLFNKPVISIAQFPYTTNRDNFLKKLKRQAIRYVYFKGTDKVLFYCKPMFERSQESGVQGDSVFVDDWGVDDQFFSDFINAQTQAPTDDYVYTTGGSCRDFHTLIKAFNEIDFNLKITTVGNFDGHEDCLITPNIHIDNSLQFGLGSTGLIRKEYYNARAVAIPLARTTEPEPFGITVIMEAMAMGKAVIATDNRANWINVEKEKAGLLVDYGDVAAWKQALQYIIDNPDEAREMGARGKHLVKKKYNYRRWAGHINKQVLSVFPAEKRAKDANARVQEQVLSSID